MDGSDDISAPGTRDWQQEVIVNDHSAALFLLLSRGSVPLLPPLTAQFPKSASASFSKERSEGPH